MKKSSNSFMKSSVIRVCKFAHILLTIAMYSFCLYHYNAAHNGHDMGHTRMNIFVVLYTVILCFTLRTYKSYNFGNTSTAMLIYSQSLSVLASGGVFYVVLVIANSKLFTPVPLLLLLVAQIILNTVWSFIGNKLYFTLNKPKKAVVFYKGKSELLRLRDIIENNKTFSVSEIVEVRDECFEDLIGYFDKNEMAFVAGLELDLRNEIIEYCVKNSVHCYVVPVIGDIIMMGSSHLDVYSVPVFDVSRREINIEYAVIKRAIDIICSLVAIVLLSPAMLVTAIAIKLYDRGPALYKQVRLTKDGREFKILKFRSMKVNAESDGVARLATDNDDRITPVGKIIRAIRFDELPQLFNILKGDMTIVGPRPERPEIAAQYEEVLPEFALRLQVKAGLTGFAQVYGKYNTEPYDKLQMDLMYVNKMSFIEDVKLIFATVKILFLKESTQGTAEGQTTALVKEEEENKA